MEKTKEELYTDLAYCYILNSQVRHRCEEALPGFIWALIMCLIAAIINTFMSFRYYNESNILLMVFSIVLSFICLLFSGITVFFIADYKKELKKCDEIDKKLQEAELELKEMF